MHWKTHWLILMVAVTLTAPAVLPAAAQSGTTITLALTDFMRNLPVDDALAEFEAQNPGIRVQPVYLPYSSFYYTAAAENIDEHLQGAEALAAAADVALVDGESLSPEATRAGYFLDLTPLASSDAAFSPADFIPAAWESFRWDNGLWALPAKIEPLLLTYDPALFDQAGLAYPDASWTLEDVAHAARTLTQYDGSGAVSIPGLVTNGSDTALLRSLYRQSLNDEAGNPRLNTPELAALLEGWAELVDEGVVSAFTTQNLVDNSIPMMIGGSFGLGSDPLNPDAVSRVLVALPGGSIGVSTTGFAVSGGTAHPTEAYQLAKFLTESATFQSALLGYRSARVNPPVASAPPAPEEGALVLAVSAFVDPQIAAQIDALLGQALSDAELRYADYLDAAIKAVTDGTDAVTALSDAELIAVTNLQTASAVRGATPLIVATPVPEVVLAPGEIELTFSAGFASQVGDWERLLREFAALDPQVGAVRLTTDFGTLSDYAEQNDCFYVNYNAVPAADLTKILALDPFLSADPAFSPDDVAGNTLALLQRDNRTWAYPFSISPTLLNYHADLLAQAGIAEPRTGWTISAFADALRALDAVIPADQKPFTDRGFGDSSLLMLIAAYGGLPIDYRTTPPVFNFTDPATVEAIRTVLDMAKDGLIAYQELAGNGFMIMIGDGENPDPIYAEASGGGLMLVGGDSQMGANPYRMTTYPTGAYSAVSYEIGTGYISATSQNPDACYRLFGFLAQHPELFGSMPALRSQFSNPALLANAGQSALDFYTRFDALMQDPNTVIIPSPFTGELSLMGDFITRRWLDAAFDDYVLHDADLLTALTDAQAKVEAFQACAAALPPYDAANPMDYQSDLQTCASAVDPEMSSMFGPGIGVIQ